jgi:predicted transglutaminase-like cysteine proteinase
MGFAANSAALLFAALVACGANDSASAASRAMKTADTPTPRASFAPITGRTSTPWGWVDFCSRYKDECPGGALQPVDVELTAKTWELLKLVNDKVNRSIKPMSDIDHWGVVDQWDLPLDGYGDCEDFALLKRKLLLSLGLPRQALLMTVVKDEHGDGHAILMVKTDRGDFILDNMRDGVKPWDAVPYTYVKRQSQSVPDIWEQIGEPTAAPLIVSR